MRQLSLLLIFYSLYSSVLRYIYWFACMSLLRLFCHIPFLNVWKKGHLNLLNAYNVLLCISIFWVFNLFYIKTPCGMCLQDYGIDFDDHDHLVKFRCRCGSNFCRNMKRSSRSKSVSIARWFDKRHLIEEMIALMLQAFTVLLKIKEIMKCTFVWLPLDPPEWWGHFLWMLFVQVSVYTCVETISGPKC